MKKQSLEEQILTVMGMPGGLTLDRNGRWFNDGAEVRHPKIAEYFSRHLLFDSNLDSFVVAVNDRCVLVSVEDAPFILKSLDLESHPPLGVFNDGLTEELDFHTLMVGIDDSIYLKRSDSGLLARFSRSAQQDFASLVTTDEQNRIVVGHAGNTYKIKKR
jgi:hypothetical protein